MIAHFDLDAFYASVAQRDDPSLRGKPLAISGSSRRAVVLTASYEARPFGVRSAMPLYHALDLCPGLVVVPPNFAAYREASQRVFAIFEDGARAVEGLSLDEAFVALPRSEGEDTAEELATAVAFARRVRARVRDEVGLTVSAGVARGKMVAKIASDANKPDGLTVVEPGTEAAYLAPLPIGRLWGIGPKTRPRLEAAGLRTIGDVALLGDARLYELFGRSGPFYRDLARGIDEREVDGSRKRNVDLDRGDVRVRRARRSAHSGAAARAGRRARPATSSQGNCAARRSGSRSSASTTRSPGARRRWRSRPTTPTRSTTRPLWCWQRAELRGVPIRLLGTRVASLTEEEARELRLF